VASPRDSLLEGFRAGDRASLARLITLVDDGEGREAIEGTLLSPTPTGKVVGVTGAPGVGKSTLIGHLAVALRGAGLGVAVLAIDPDSPLTGGALLGDRVRMAVADEDKEIFIRSLSARGAPGGISASTGITARLLMAFGFDRVLVETVGAGQGDRGLQGVADMTVLVTMPGTGDEVQWEKAGLTELADLFVVNKADLPGADAVETAIRAAMTLSSGASPTIVQTEATQGRGVERLAEAIEARLAAPREEKSHG
jgi:LAO/AO transport system kinase